MDLFNLSDAQRAEILDTPDDELANYSFSSPWQYDDSSDAASDSDGFRSNRKTASREQLQEECWRKFHTNPQINTSERAKIGRLTGRGFEVTSDIREIQEVIDEETYDYRNRLYDYYPKWVGRADVEGELFLTLTCHDDGFIETDFIDPSLISGCEDNTGIIFHPRKSNMPLFYNIIDDQSDIENGIYQEQIPSIYIARYPDLLSVAKKSMYYDSDLQQDSMGRARRYNKVGGYRRFIVNWDKTFITKRNVSHLRTVIEWCNYYENLKKYEMDHKKSSGAYLWIFKITEPRAYKTWLSLSDSDKQKTGIMSKKTPGGSLVLPPGIDVEVKNPQLPKISDSDTDIMQMISSGLNESIDTLTGSLSSTNAASKSSKGPATDRINDEIAYFERFLLYDFWANIFFLKSQISSFPDKFKVREAVSFNKKKEPIFKNVYRRPEELIEISFPISENVDFESATKGLLGVKHGPVSDTVGVSNREVARRLGFGSYGRMRLRKATEDETYPQLLYTADAESIQEQLEAEPGKKKPPVAEKQPEEVEDATEVKEEDTEDGNED